MLVRQILAFPVASSSSERLFSTAALFDTDLIGSLCYDTLEMLAALWQGRLCCVSDEEMQQDEVVVSDSDTESEDSFESEDSDLDANLSSDDNEMEKDAEDDKQMEEESDTND